MGLLNHLFGSEEDIAREFVMDDKKRMALWNKHMVDYKLREELSKHFGNADKAMQDFKATAEILGQIEALISPEMIDIANEKKIDKEILADLERLKKKHELEKLAEIVVSVKQKESALLELFREIFNVLKAELHLMGLIRKKPANVKELLIRLFELIFHHEARLYKVFREEYFFDENKHIHQNIVRIAKAIILEEEVKEEMETDEEKFAREMAEQMAPGESKRRYRKLGEDIFLKLAEMAGAPMPRGEDITEGIKRMELLMKKDKTMYSIVKGLRPKYDDAKIKVVIAAFRKAYDLWHFEELEAEFAT